VSRAVLSIGSNMGDRLAHLQSVCDGLAGAVVAVSGVYSTAPWGGVDQQDFLNAVLLVDDPQRSARQWLEAGQELEQQADRRREQHWGPRTLDVDVISVSDNTDRAVFGEDSPVASVAPEIVTDDPVLTLPHPRAADRAFVLIPWLDVDVDAVMWHAGRRVPVATLLDALPARERDGVRRTGDSLVLSSRGGVR
jgi:2-amino-4-hydroxy-6-hydroxymethyldihydropteridine diphosphokinase